MQAYKSLPNLGFDPPLSGVLRNEMRWLVPSSMSPAGAGVHSRGFEGRGFLAQFTTATDSYGSPTHNICGTQTYRKLDSHVDADTTFGIPEWNEHFEYDYVFDETVGSESVRVAITGDVTGFPGGACPVTPDHADFYRTRNDGHGSDEQVKVGQADLLSPVDHAYLTQKAKTWLSKSASFHAATSGGYYGFSGAGLSESPSGFYCYVYCMAVSAQGNDLTPDWLSGTPPAVYRYGYPSGYKAKALLVTRKNSPVLQDFEDSTSAQGLGIYRSGREGVILHDPIVNNKWKDVCGVYERRDPSAFDSVGFEENYPSSLLVPPPTSSRDRTALVGFVSANGSSSYRLTLSTGYHTGADWTSLATEVIIVNPGETATYLSDTFVDGASEVIIQSLEERVVGSEYVTLHPSDSVPMIGGLIQSRPGTNSKLLMVMKVREGYRWGHKRLDAVDATDRNDTEYFLSKTTFRNLRAETLPL